MTQEADRELVCLDRHSLSDFYRRELLENVLPFWLQYAVDWEQGGIMTCLDRDGRILDTDKGIWQQGRAAWLFARVYNALNANPDYLKAAATILEFLSRFGADASDGRMWFHVTRDGHPIRKRRYAFSEAFAAIAYGEMAQVTGQAEYATRAEHWFARYMAMTQQPPPELAKFTSIRQRRALGGPMIAIITAQELRRSISLPQAESAIDWGIDTIRRYHVHPELQCVLENVHEDGSADLDHFDGWTMNPGHAIEGAWFIMWEGYLRNRAEWIQLGCQMLDWMWNIGWDETYGGLLYFVGVGGRASTEYWHDMKFWWPHNEAIIATLLAWCLTGDLRYARMHQQVHTWAFEHFADLEHGEWFGYLHRDGQRSNNLKGNLWKGPFHLPRMLLVCLEILARVPAGPQPPHGGPRSAKDLSIRGLNG
jgi:N-acylglucosamine 2-epimerase